MKHDLAFHPDIDDWIAAAREGSAEDLGRALESFRDYLLLVAGRDLGTDLIAKAGASDLVQETFLGAQRNFGQFVGESPAELQAWLGVILKNNLANFRRHYREVGKRQVGREVALPPIQDGASDPLQALPADATSPSGFVIRIEREQAMLDALNRLPERYRRVVLWHHHERLSFEEIGHRLECSAEAARKLWPRALVRLRQELGPVHDPR
ncbi:MAG: sigma-70 family RNA polymerase sigma factor [Isosphaeraceae bacterium]